MKNEYKNIKAISFDLDDTLYDNKVVIKRAFKVLFQYLVDEYPKVSHSFNYESFLKAATKIQQQNPAISDLTLLRQKHINLILKTSGYKTGDEKAFQVFWRARQNVDLYPGVIKLLKELQNKLPLISISNGNACPQTIGISQYFKFHLNVTDTGKPKPHPSLFLLGCHKLEIMPGELLHIGDDFENDVQGAESAGCQCIWYNPQGQSQMVAQNTIIKNLEDLLLFKFGQ